MAERSVESLEVWREQNRGPQHEVKLAASSNYQPKGVREGRAAHITAKAKDIEFSSEHSMDLSGVERAGRDESLVRDRRDPTRQSSRTKTERIRPEAENARSRAGVRAERRGAAAFSPGSVVRKKACGKTRRTEGTLLWSRVRRR